MNEQEPNPDSKIRMDAYDALPPSLRKAISESLPDAWDTWTALDLFRRGFTDRQLMNMVRTSEINCHKEEVSKGLAAEVPSLDFILKSRKIRR